MTSKYEYDRPSKSIDDRIEILRSRGVEISDPATAMQILSGIPYYSLVNNNKDVFCLDPQKDKYKPNVKIEHMYFAHIAQRSIYSIFLKYIIYVEETFKIQLAELVTSEFAEEYKLDISDKNNNYLYYGHYSSGSQRRINICKKLVANIESNKRERRNSATWHYADKTNIPAWISIRDMYFSLAFQWYKILKPEHKEIINKDLLHINPEVFNKLITNEGDLQNFVNYSLNILIDYRNAFAHGQKPYPYKVYSYLPLSLLEILFPSQYNCRELYNIGIGKKDFVALFLILQTLLFNKSLKFSLMIELKAQFNVFKTYDFGDLSFFDIMSMPDNMEEMITDIFDYLFV